ncbi:signal peptide peptidase SppA [Desulfobaculum senezii]
MFRRRLCLCVMLFTVISLAACAPKISLFGDGSGQPLAESVISGTAPEKVLVIPVTGTISTAPPREFGPSLSTRPSLVQEVVSHLRRAEADPDIRAVVLMVDSPGGTVVASDTLYHEVMAFRQRTGRPVVALMHNVAASGGYYVSIAADHIVAHPTTVTGSIGTVLIVPKLHGLMEKVGVSTMVIKSGELKDMGSPFRASPEKERKLLQNMIDDMNSRFLQAVKARRRLDQKALDAVADARVLMANEAVRLGLVDATGYTEDALAKARDLAELSEDARVVVYRRTRFPDDNLYNTATGSWSGPLTGGTTLVLPDVLSTPRTGFYHLWTPALGGAAGN